MAESIRYVRVKDASTGNFLTDIIPFAVNLNNVILDQQFRINGQDFAPNVSSVGEVINALAAYVASATDLIASPDPTTGLPIESTSTPVTRVAFIKETISVEDEE